MTRYGKLSKALGETAGSKDDGRFCSDSDSVPETVDYGKLSKALGETAGSNDNGRFCSDSDSFTETVDPSSVVLQQSSLLSYSAIL